MSFRQIFFLQLRFEKKKYIYYKFYSTQNREIFFFVFGFAVEKKNYFLAFSLRGVFTLAAQLLLEIYLQSENIGEFCLINFFSSSLLFFLLIRYLLYERERDLFSNSKILFVYLFRLFPINENKHFFHYLFINIFYFDSEVQFDIFVCFE